MLCSYLLHFGSSISLQDYSIALDKCLLKSATSSSHEHEPSAAFFACTLFSCLITPRSTDAASLPWQEIIRLTHVSVSRGRQVGKAKLVSCKHLWEDSCICQRKQSDLCQVTLIGVKKASEAPIASWGEATRRYASGFQVLRVLSVLGCFGVASCGYGRFSAGRHRTAEKEHPPAGQFSFPQEDSALDHSLSHPCAKLRVSR